MTAHQTHHFPCTLQFGTHETWAYYSLRPKGTAVVFVHGFTGKALETWTEFDRLLRDEPKCAGIDLMFVGYESVSQDSTSSASLLRDILLTLSTKPQDLKQWPTNRNRAFRYRRFIVVAHSLGAVVARRALLMGHKRCEEWPRRCSLILYAPAHFGARLERLIRCILPRKWMELLGYSAPTVEELRPKSDALTKLKRDTEAALSAGADYLKAIKVVQARSDNIIFDKNEVFCRDVDADWEDGTHLTICKPDSNNRRPLTHLLSKL